MVCHPSLRVEQPRALDEAIEQSNKAIELAPNFAEAYYNRGFAYAKLGQFERAIEDTMRLYDSTHSMPLPTNRGTTYYDLGKKSETISDFQVCLTLTTDPKLIEMVKQQIEEFSK